MKIQTVFKRVEKKYLLTKEQYETFLSETKSLLQQDAYGKTTICNIYFDTENDSLIIHSLQKPVYKEKFRIRSYGIADENSVVFLEIKKKFNGVVYKRRMTMPILEAENYFQTGEMTASYQGNIPNEIDYMLKKYALQPKVFIAYDRTAYFNTENSSLRVTFDENIRSRYENISLKSDSGCQRLLPENTVLMEIKIPGAMPLWLSRLLSANHIFPISFSKYGRIHEIHLQEDKNTCSQVS